MERRVLRAASVGAAMACDIVINYPLWIVAKRVGAGLSALPPLHDCTPAAARSGRRSRRRPSSRTACPPFSAPRCRGINLRRLLTPSTRVCRVRRDRGRLRDVAGRAVHHRGARPKSVGPRDGRGHLSTRRRRWSCCRPAWRRRRAAKYRSPPRYSRCGRACGPSRRSATRRATVPARAVLRRGRRLCRRALRRMRPRWSPRINRPPRRRQVAPWPTYTRRAAFAHSSGACPRGQCRWLAPSRSCPWRWIGSPSSKPLLVFCCVDTCCSPCA